MAFFSINRSRESIAADLSDTDASTKFEVSSKIGGDWHIYITQVFGNPDLVTVDVVDMSEDEQVEYEGVSIRDRGTFSNDLDFHIFIGFVLGIISKE